MRCRIGARRFAAALRSAMFLAHFIGGGSGYSAFNA
jgi:hypothetical protein